MSNYAFIDSQNLYLGIKSLGWKLDYKRFRVYLREKYRVKRAYLFIGYIQSNHILYKELEKAGFILMFKPVLYTREGRPKGNVDADLVLRSMIAFTAKEFDEALIITSDGDFYSLVEYFYSQGCLARVLSPYKETCSVLLKMKAKEKLVFMDNLRSKLEYKRKSTA
jgi:uncharacterized LabA/DUF88 family protein